MYIGLIKFCLFAYRAGTWFMEEHAKKHGVTLTETQKKGIAH